MRKIIYNTCQPKLSQQFNLLFAPINDSTNKFIMKQSEAF